MLTEVMRHYRLARPPLDVGFFETEHHEQIVADLRVAITTGRLVALTAVIGSGKSLLVRRLREALESENRIIVSRALSLEKAKITVPLLVSALFYELNPEKTPVISTQTERRERDLLDLFRKAKQPVALFVDDARDLHANKRLARRWAPAPAPSRAPKLHPDEGARRELIPAWAVRRNARSCESWIGWGDDEAAGRTTTGPGRRSARRSPEAAAAQAGGHASASRPLHVAGTPRSGGLDH